jgi:hypothetical protein
MNVYLPALRHGGGRMMHNRYLLSSGTVKSPPRVFHESPPAGPASLDRGSME